MKLNATFAFVGLLMGIMFLCGNFTQCFHNVHSYAALLLLFFIFPIIFRHSLACGTLCMNELTWFIQKLMFFTFRIICRALLGFLLCVSLYRHWWWCTFLAVFGCLIYHFILGGCKIDWNRTLRSYILSKIQNHNLTT